MSVVFTIKVLHEFDDITSGIASGKAVPNIFRKADNKGVGVIATMNGTRAEELIASFFKLCHPRLGVKYRHDGDAALHRPIPTTAITRWLPVTCRLLSK